MAGIEVHEWKGRAVDAWRKEWGVPALRIFRSIGSTSDLAREMAEAGADVGTTVIADEQTRGRGRRGREWLSPTGKSLAISMVLRPGTRGASRLLTLRLGLAAARGIERTSPVNVGMKWPNDLIVDGRKIGGILCESAVEHERVTYVVAGIGLNVRQRDDDWPAHLAGHATSLAAAAGTAIDSAALAGAIIGEWLTTGRVTASRLDPTEREQFDQRDVLQGQRIQVEGADAGVAAGISANGALRVRRDGRELDIVAGTVRTHQQREGERT